MHQIHTIEIYIHSWFSFKLQHINFTEIPTTLIPYILMKNSPPISACSVFCHDVGHEPQASLPHNMRGPRCSSNVEATPCWSANTSAKRGGSTRQHRLLHKGCWSAPQINAPRLSLSRPLIILIVMSVHHTHGWLWERFHNLGNVFTAKHEQRSYPLASNTEFH